MGDPEYRDLQQRVNEERWNPGPIRIPVPEALEKKVKEFLVIGACYAVTFSMLFSTMTYFSTKKHLSDGNLSCEYKDEYVLAFVTPKGVYENASAVLSMMTYPGVLAAYALNSDCEDPAEHVDQ